MRNRVLIALLPLALTACGYNRIQTLDETAEKAKQGIDVQLQRRADLIPNLVSTVRGYAKHEEEVFTQVANARAGLLGAMQQGDMTKTADANAVFGTALGRLIAVAENYPQLKADQGFMNLQIQLEGTENRISVSRNDYNDAVRDYNAYIRTFPQAITAKVTGAKPRTYYQLSDTAARNAPAIDFSKPPPPKK